MRKWNYRLVLLGLVISLFGSAIQRFCFSLYLLDLTRDAGIYANALAISTLPFIFLAPFAGSVADNRNKKHIMIVLDFCSCTVIMLYVILQGLGGQQGFPGTAGNPAEILQSSWGYHVILTALVMFLLSAISTFYTPAVTTIIPELVEPENLVKANAQVSQVSSMANLFGPILAGILYGVLGIRGVTILNGVSFFLSAVMEIFIQYESQIKEKKAISVAQTLGDMKETFHYLRKEKRLSFNFILSYGLFNIVLIPIMTVLLPYVLRTLMGISSSGYGVVEGVVAAGMILGAFLVSMAPKHFSVDKMYRWNYLMPAALVMMVLALGSSRSPVIYVIWAAGGFLIMTATGIGNVVTLSYTHTVVERSRLGTVSALSTAIATASAPLGQVLYGRYLGFSSNLTLLFAATFAATMFVVLFVRNSILKYA